MQFDLENLSLDSHLCFNLYVTSRAVQRLYNPQLKALGLTYPQYLVLVSLSEQPVMTVNEIGHLLDLESGTLTPLLKRMESIGFISRSRRHDDERVVQIELLPAGRAKRQEALMLPKMLVEKSGLNEEEWHDLFNLTAKLFHNLSQE
ncbi:MarR family transcriptional regulator [Weissella diestrammenae]|uniref:MarR family transcriptional regulator n=1 Tax=Weissella diestrammenae TaxID=1162633 RepID=A0A7G9T3G2_9LACO|nr:MarR family transcriptional regulator [Weissella diestrammenae]MCM0582094.1 MarR family transcriptional regulator [Weissella diestrammenae]QNN74637.1 MarR family transcriptional regulator [Weissella diestrammenae]